MPSFRPANLSSPSWLVPCGLSLRITGRFKRATPESVWRGVSQRPLVREVQVEGRLGPARGQQLALAGVPLDYEAIRVHAWRLDANLRVLVDPLAESLAESLAERGLGSLRDLDLPVTLRGEVPRLRLVDLETIALAVGVVVVLHENHEAIMLARVLTVVEHLFHAVSALCSRERQRLRIDPEVWTEEQAVRHSQVLAQGGEQPVLAEDARLAQVQLPVDPIVLLDLEHCGVRRQGA
mmetsp:Transcript_6745/g.20892  ORF Transcript_6745/g.20892 Transcript_6745/m.20892 type:complete len:237 (-) Transcript_6745:1047-1757(-)